MLTNSEINLLVWSSFYSTVSELPGVFYFVDEETYECHFLDAYCRMSFAWRQYQSYDHYVKSDLEFLRRIHKQRREDG